MILKNLGKIFFLVFTLQAVVFGRFEFTQTLSKDTINLNETIKVTLTLSFENNESELIDLVDFEEYESIDFWKTIHTNQTKKRDGYKWTYIYEYLLEPKKSGTYILPQQLIKVSSYQIRKQKRFVRVYSNTLNIAVLPLVEDISIQGNYSIDFKVNKKQIKPNDSIKGQLLISGSGNLKDIKEYDLKLDEQIVYSDELDINTNFTNTTFEGNVSQEFLILSTKSFTIPSFSLEYYNPDLDVIELKQTEPIFIEVIEEKIQNKDELWVKYLFLFIGILLGLVAIKYYTQAIKYFTKKKMPLYKSVQKTKDTKELYDLLIKYNHDKQFSLLIKKLENEIYKDTKEKAFKEYKKETLKILLF